METLQTSARTLQIDIGDGVGQRDPQIWRSQPLYARRCAVDSTVHPATAFVNAGCVRKYAQLGIDRVTQAQLQYWRKRFFLVVAAVRPIATGEAVTGGFSICGA